MFALKPTHVTTILLIHYIHVLMIQNQSKMLKLVGEYSNPFHILLTILLAGLVMELTRPPPPIVIKQKGC